MTENEHTGPADLGGVDLGPRLRAEIPADLARAGLFEDVAVAVRRRSARNRIAGAATGVLAVAAAVAVYSGTAAGSGGTVTATPGRVVTHPASVDPALSCPAHPQPDQNPPGGISQAGPAPGPGASPDQSRGLFATPHPDQASPRLLTGAPTSITVCRYHVTGDGVHGRVLTGADLAQAVTALDHAEVISKDTICTAVKIVPHSTLVAHYAGKPDELLDIDLSGCGSVSNGTFTTLLPSAISKLVR